MDKMEKEMAPITCVPEFQTLQSVLLWLMPAVQARLMATDQGLDA